MSDWAGIQIINQMNPRYAYLSVCCSLSVSLYPVQSLYVYVCCIMQWHFSFYLYCYKVLSLYIYLCIYISKSSVIV